jgi:hypothetical protein
MADIHVLKPSRKGTPVHEFFRQVSESMIEREQTQAIAVCLSTKDTGEYMHSVHMHNLKSSEAVALLELAKNAVVKSM